MHLQHRLGLDPVFLEEGGGAGRGQQFEPLRLQAPGGRNQLFGSVALRHSHQHRAGKRQRAAGPVLRLEKGHAERGIQAQHLAGGTHFRTQHRIHFGEHVEGEHRFLHADMRNVALGEIEIAQGFAEQDFGGDAGHRDAADLGDQRHRARGAWIGFQHVHRVVADRVLNVHQADHPHLAGDGAGVLANRSEVLFRNPDRRDDAG